MGEMEILASKATLSEMCVLATSGDQKFIWDPDSEVEVEVVETAFKKLLKEGFKIFRVGKDHLETGGALRSFPRTAGKLIAIPPLEGG